MWIVKCWVHYFGEYTCSQEYEFYTEQEADEAWEIENRNSIWDKVTLERAYFEEY